MVDKNLKADLNFNFEEIGLKFDPDTMDLLKSLLKKMPKSRISASDALNHSAFKVIQSLQVAEEDQILENSGIQNLKEFHEKYARLTTGTSSTSRNSQRSRTESQTTSQT